MRACSPAPLEDAPQEGLEPLHLVHLAWRVLLLAGRVLLVMEGWAGQSQGWPFRREKKWALAQMSRKGGFPIATTAKSMADIYA